MDVRFHRLATKDYLDALRWYTRRSKRAAGRFLVAIDDGLEKIKDDPYFWPLVMGNIRWIRARRFPYLIYYQIIDSQVIQILAIAHGKRRYGYWKGRKTKP